MKQLLHAELLGGFWASGNFYACLSWATSLIQALCFCSLIQLCLGLNLPLQLSAMDVWAQATMKSAAKCDKHCELQNSVNQQNFERDLRCWANPDSMPASVSWLCFLLQVCASGDLCAPGLETLTRLNFGSAGYLHSRE